MFFRIVIEQQCISIKKFPVMKNRETEGEKGRSRQRPASGTRSGSVDYWDRIARDVAEGYGAQKGRGRNVLNPDQRPDDARRGDA
jgi:hypothetical protein